MNNIRELPKYSYRRRLLLGKEKSVPSRKLPIASIKNCRRYGTGVHSTCTEYSRIVLLIYNYSVPVLVLPIQYNEYGSSTVYKYYRYIKKSFTNHTVRTYVPVIIISFAIYDSRSTIAARQSFIAIAVAAGQLTSHKLFVVRLTVAGWIVCRSPRYRAARTALKARNVTAKGQLVRAQPWRWSEM